MLRRVGTDIEAKRKYDRETKAARTKLRKASGTYVRSGSHEDMARWTATMKPRKTTVKSFGCDSSCGKLDCSKAYAYETALMAHQQLAGPRHTAFEWTTLLASLSLPCGAGSLPAALGLLARRLGTRGAGAGRDAGPVPTSLGELYGHLAATPTLTNVLAMGKVVSETLANLDELEVTGLDLEEPPAGWVRAAHLGVPPEGWDLAACLDALTTAERAALAQLATIV